MNTTNAELSPPLRKRMMISTVVVMGSGLGTDAPPRKTALPSNWPCLLHNP